MRCILLSIVLLARVLPATAQWDWPLVWADEFDGEGLPDTSSWRYDVGGNGWGNQELQYYTARRLQNARVENGLLVIEAHREEFQSRDYTSARLVSRRDWTYGRFEIRAKLPSGRGTWPAIWMLATRDTYGEHYWPDNGEIDIMEMSGRAIRLYHAGAVLHTSPRNWTVGHIGWYSNYRRYDDGRKLSLRARGYKYETYTLLTAIIEAALEVQQARYEDLFESANDGIFLLDRQARFITVNQKYAKMVGISK